MLCLRQNYLYFKNGKKYFNHISNIQKEFKSKKSLQELIINHRLAIVPCGKCEICLSSKINYIAKKVKNQFKKSTNIYLITLTFDDNNILTLSPKSLLQKNDISFNSTLSKYQILKVIQNIKNKLKKYYNNNVSINYLLCGEYGKSTQRAHYHILLMLNKELPYLKKENVKGLHYKSKIINFKGLGKNYDISLIPFDDFKKTSKYITKYILKQNDYQDYINYNRFQSQLLYYFMKKNIYVAAIPKSEIDFYKLLINYLEHKNIFKIDFVNTTYQKPFIKLSRKLGISNDDLDNINNGVWNAYYKYKFFEKNNIEYNNYLSNFEYYKYVNLTLYAWEKKRKNNILLYFGKHQKIIKSKNNKKDVF